MTTKKRKRVEARLPSYLDTFVRERAAEMHMSIAGYVELLVSIEYDRHNQDKDKLHANAPRNGV